MRKLTIIALMLLASVFVLADVSYQYTGDSNLWFDGELLKTNDTVIVDYFMYDDDFTLLAATPTDILMDVTSVSTSAVATQTIAVTELAEVKLELDLGTSNVSPVTVYFNSTNTNGITVTEDWDITLDTKYFYQVILVNTATTTSYNFIVTKVF